VAKSLVLTCACGDTTRYRFLESLREYAVEKLRESGEEPIVRQRHSDWLIALAGRAESGLTGPDSARWLDRLEHERENVRAALSWCAEHGKIEAGLWLVGALTQFWLVRGPYREIRETLEELLAAPGAQGPGPSIRAARTKALLAAGRLAMRQGDRAVAERHFQEALELSWALGDQRSRGIAHFSLGHVARVRSDYAAARAHHAVAVRVFEAMGDDHWLANTHHDLGLAAYYEGDLATARQEYDVTLALSRGLGDEHGIASALNDLGELALLQGALDEARRLECESLTIARWIEDKKLIAMAFGALAGVAVAQSRPTRALRLAAAATALNEATGQRHSPAWHAMLDRWLEPARRAMNAEACEAAQAAGRAMSLEEAIEYALTADPAYGGRPTSGRSAPAPPAAFSKEVAGTPSPGRSVAGASSSRGAPQPSGAAPELTLREREVATLVARGLSNRQIADELVIAKGTAANHVKHILARLGVESRAQIAAWAVEHGLLGRFAS
jgi:non-specific serine/threonine protein kinase